MIWFRVGALGLLLTLLTACAAQHQPLPPRAGLTYLQEREIHHRTVTLAEPDFALVHKRLLQLALDKGSRYAPSRNVADVGTKTLGLTYTEPVECPEIQEIAFGRPVPCIDDVTLVVARADDSPETHLELYVTRHLPTVAQQIDAKKRTVKNIRLQNTDYRPKKHDPLIHSQVFSQLSNQLSIQEIETTLRTGTPGEAWRFSGLRPSEVSSAIQPAFKELGTSASCWPVVIDMQGNYRGPKSYYCRGGRLPQVGSLTQPESCRVLVVPANGSDTDVRLRCFTPSAIQYSHSYGYREFASNLSDHFVPRVVVPFTPDWSRGFFDSLGRVLFIDKQNIPVRKL